MYSCKICQKRYDRFDNTFLKLFSKNIEGNIICCQNVLCRCEKTLQTNIVNYDDKTFECQKCKTNLNFNKIHLTDEPYTFKQLYEFLQTTNYETIQEWLEDKNDIWIGKEKQESILRLFAQLKLINKISKYQLCSGNFNKMQITTEKSQNKDFFIDKNGKYRIVKDNGDSSDVTLMNKINKTILTISSKNYKKINVKQTDIDTMNFHFNQYKDYGYKQNFGLCLKTNEQYEQLKRCRISNQMFKDILKDENTILITWEDLNYAFKLFKERFRQIKFSELILKDIQNISFRLHQSIAIKKILCMKKDNVKNILLGHIQRSGKSYTIIGTIYYDSIDKESYNALLITTCPNETIDQYLKLGQSLLKQDFSVHYINGKNKEPKITTKRNLFICSKQYLQDTKGEVKSTYLQKIVYDMCFLDESHNGGTTDISQNILQTYMKDSLVVHVTATYLKPQHTFSIQKGHQLLWDLEDIQLIKNIDNEQNFEILKKKHGKDFENELQYFSYEQIKKDYELYPELNILTTKLTPETVQQIINDTKDNKNGFSMNSIFLLNEKGTDFQNKDLVLDQFYKIFGKYGNFGIPVKEYPDEIVYMKRVQRMINIKYCGQKHQNSLLKEPQIYIAFMPQNVQQKGGINTICQLTKQLLEQNNVIPDFEIGITNSIENSERATKILQNTVDTAKLKNKKRVLILTGTQLSMGISIKECDNVLLLNDTVSFDLIYQMMFRSMTEREGDKQAGFVYDPNPVRAITNTITYAQMICKNVLDIKKSIKYFYEQKIIQINWDQIYYKNQQLEELITNSYEIYKYNFIPQLSNIFNDLKNKIKIFSEDSFLNTLIEDFKNKDQKLKELVNNLEQDNELTKIQKGLEKITLEGNEEPNEIDQDLEECSKTRESNDNTNEVQKKDITQIIFHMIPYMCLLTINNEEYIYENLIQEINDNELLKKHLTQQMCNWWSLDHENEQIQTNILNKFIEMYKAQSESEKDTLNEYTKIIKRLFKDFKKEPAELSKKIDEYLKALSQDIKTLAEIPTPYQLRQEMLDLVPKEFWTKPHKVFEPSAGKGGFLIDIYYRFFEGMKETIPDEKQRRKVILEECIYFSEFNPMNVYICELLLQSTGTGKCKLNSNCGDTLILDIKKKWEIDGFDLVVGNPPYQKNYNNKNGRVGGSSLWSEFINYVFQYIKQNGFLLFITPCSWMTGGTNKQSGNILKGVFQQNTVIYLNINECQKYFSGVGSTFSYYLIQKRTTNQNFKCITQYKKQIFESIIDQDIFRNLNIIPKLFIDQSINIINKVENKNNIKFNFQRKRDLDSDAQKYKFISNGKYIVKHKVVEILKTDYFQNDCMNQHKIIISMPGYIKLQYDFESGCTDATLFMKCINKEKAYQLIKIINSKLYQFIINNYRELTGLNNHKNINKLSIYQNEIHQFTDQDIYQYFNLTEDEIKLIEENV